MTAPTTNTASTAPTISAAIRSQIWQTLATYFSPPDKELWEQALKEGSFVDLDKAVGLLPGGTIHSSRDYEFECDMSFDVLHQAYSSCFEVGNAPVSFHERAYTNDAANKLFEELFRYYEFFGLDLKNNSNTHWPDSLLVELDFMHYLSYLESIATNEENILSLQRGQRDFLKRHLCPLVTGISDQLAVMNIIPYMQLSILAKNFALQDKNYLARIVDSPILATS